MRDKRFCVGRVMMVRIVNNELVLGTEFLEEYKLHRYAYTNNFNIILG
jgi:hypothetical protein